MRIYFDIPLGREVHERHLRERPGCHRHHRLLWTSLAKVKIPIILSDIVSVLHQNEAGRYWEIHPETPETSQGSREICGFPDSSFGGVQTFYASLILP